MISPLILAGFEWPLTTGGIQKIRGSICDQCSRLCRLGGIWKRRDHSRRDGRILWKASIQIRNKPITMDNASSHRNPLVKQAIDKHNTLLLSVSYQHFTNSIENWFSMFKAYLRKVATLTYKEIITSVPKALRKLKPESYYNTIRCTFQREKEYKQRDSTRYLRPAKKYKNEA